MTTSTIRTTTNLFCVVYRRGGTDNFTWHRSDAMPAAQAAELRGEVARMGYKAMVVNYVQSMAIGLPETYE